MDAYQLVSATSIQNAVEWCDVQLTKDRAGVCLPDIKLNNATNIANVFQNKPTNYVVNGVPTTGYFSVDYTLKDLTNVMSKFNYFFSTFYNCSLVQGLMSHLGSFFM